MEKWENAKQKRKLIESFGFVLFLFIWLKIQMNVAIFLYRRWNMTIYEHRSILKYHNPLFLIAIIQIENGNEL